MKHLPEILICVIPHDEQDYPTVGNYKKRPFKDCWTIEISKTKADYEFLILIHELVEFYLTQRQGISESSITKFDKAFEKKRKPHNHDEPGDDPRAPYHDAHRIATWIEKNIANELDINWKQYEKTLNKL